MIPKNKNRFMSTVAEGIMVQGDNPEAAIRPKKMKKQN